MLDGTSKMMYSFAMEIYDYTTAGGKNLIMEHIEKLSAASRATVLDVRKLIREEGISAFDMLNTRQLYHKLWEIKISQERIMYVIRDIDSVYFLHMCKKQKGKAEQKEIELARKRAREEGLL